jgi:hypothetical protein
MKFLRQTSRTPREERPRGSLDGPSRTITVEPVETPTPAPPPEVHPEPSREPARPSKPAAPPAPAR